MCDYKDLYESALIGLWRISITDTKFLSVNDKTSEIFGFSSIDEMCNHRLEEFTGSDAISYLIEQAQANKEVKNFYVTLNKLDGSKIYVRISAKICPDKGCVEGTVESVENNLSLESQLEKINKLNLTLKKKLILEQPSFAHKTSKL